MRAVCSVLGSCTILVLALTAWYAAEPEHATASSGGHQVLEVVGQVGGFVAVMTVEGDYGYVATGPRLTVLDLSSGGSPRLVGTSDPLPVHGPFHHLAVDGDVVFGSVAGNPIQVISVSRPERPILLGAFATGHGGGAVAAARGILFVAHGTEVLAFDVANPMAPQLVSTTEVFADTTQFLIHHDLLFVVCERERGMAILDVSDASAALVAKWFEDIDVRGVAVGGGLVYLMVFEKRPLPGHPDIEATYQRVQVHDASPASGFAELGRLELGSPEEGGDAPAESLVADGRTAFLSVQSEVLVVDAADPTSPAEVARLDIPPNANMGSASPRGGIAYPGRMVATDGRLFVTFDEYMPDRPHSYTAGVAVYSVSDPEDPIEVGSWTQSAPGNVADLAVVGDVLLVGEIPADRVRVYDLADGTSPRQLATIEVDTGVRDFAADGQRMVVLDEASYALHVIDMRDPSQPSLVARRELWRATAVEISGDYVYAAFYGPGETGDDVGQLAILHLAPGGELEELYRLEGLPRGATDLAFAGDTLVLAHRSFGLTFIDVHDPNAPIVVGAFDPPHVAMGMSVVNDMAYLAVKLPTPEDERDQPVWPTYGGVMLVDVAEPSHPSEIATNGVHLDDYRGNVERWGMAVTNGVALLAAAEGYVRAFDVRDPASPREVQKLRVPGVVGAAATRGQYAYIAGQDAGLLILRVNGFRDTAGTIPIYLPLAACRQ